MAKRPKRTSVASLSKFGVPHKSRNKTVLNPVLRGMKGLFSRHPWLCIGGFVSFLAVCSSAAHPFGTPKRFDARRPAVEDLKIPPEVAALLRRSCTDCHSNQTVWPWYSYVAPVSWLVERDVAKGRNRLNFSDWNQYSLKQREKFFSDIASAVKNQEMPLSQYTLVHRRAKLSEEEKDAVYVWARLERRKLRTISAGK